MSLSAKLTTGNLVTVNGRAMSAAQILAAEAALGVFDAMSRIGQQIAGAKTPNAARPWGRRRSTGRNSDVESV
jgi:hypothetical protein